MTADGAFRKASASDDPDLFWALRGGGGNFGVVTAFEYRLHPVTEVLGGLVIYPLDQARDVLRFYRDFCPTLPDEAEAYAAAADRAAGHARRRSAPRLQRVRSPRGSESSLPRAASANRSPTSSDRCRTALGSGSSTNPTRPTAYIGTGDRR